MDGPSQWPRAERLNAQRMASAIQASAGVALQVDGPCPGGFAPGDVNHWLDLAEQRAG